MCIRDRAKVTRGGLENAASIAAMILTTECLITDIPEKEKPCLLYTSDAADERSSVDLGGRRIIKKKKNI